MKKGKMWFEENRLYPWKAWTTILILATLVVMLTAFSLMLNAKAISSKTFCGQEEHTHTEACYAEDGSLACDEEEHEHSLLCFSDKEADLETSDDWEKTFRDVELSGDWGKDLAAIAKTQIGYKESEKNYILDDSEEASDDESIQGYNRYGQWSGDEYAKWNMLFASFCLSYAEVDKVVQPKSDDMTLKEWISDLDDSDLYVKKADGCDLSEGDLVFLKDKDDEISQVGIISDITTDADKAVKSFKVIIGDVEGEVCEKSFDAEDESIAGYGIIPENPDYVDLTQKAEDDDSDDNAGSDDNAADEPSKTASAKKAPRMLKLLGAPVPPDGYDIPDSYLSKNAPICDINATWNGSSVDTAFSVRKTGAEKNEVLMLQYNDSGLWVSQGSQKAGANGATLTASNTVSVGFDSQWKATASTKAGSNAYTFTVYDILESIKPGFDEWLRYCYRQYFGGTKLPGNIGELYTAFDIYLNMPTATISCTNDKDVSVTMSGGGTYTYEWEYYDKEDESWKSLGATAATIDASTYNVLNDGGAKLRVKASRAGAVVSVSNTLFVNPRQAEYDAAINAINTGLKLSASKIPYRKTNATTPSYWTYDLSIGGTIFNHFFFGNVARDESVPFEDAETYKNYLAKTYLNAGGGQAGLDAVKEKWDYYLYDIFDANVSGLGNISKTYPEATYGDDKLSWPKDSYSSYHTDGAVTQTSSTPDGDKMIQPLNYDYLENGVNYDNFISDLDKQVTARAAGDANTDRKYDVKLTAKAQSKAPGPTAIIFQIPTAWQVFDMNHANAKVGEGATEKGTCADNTELANLYDIKHALIRLMNYLESDFPGNNLVIGVTEAQHGGSSSMLLGTVNGTQSMVSNNHDMLKNGLYRWDSFGNCEHVHYDNNTLNTALSKLPSNLSGWYYMGDGNHQIPYNEIEKSVVVLGGSTELSDGTNGYGCTLPWSSFRTAGIDTVYGIRVNEGTAANKDGLLSWIDNSGNNTGAPYTSTGTGNNFTEKYVATNEDAIYEALVEIVNKEFEAKAIDCVNDTAHIDDTIVTDVVSPEFEIDEDDPKTFTVKVVDKEGTVVRSEVIDTDDENLELENNEDGSITVKYNFGQVFNGTQCYFDFAIKAKDDYIGSNNVKSNVGVPTVDYNHTVHVQDSSGSWVPTGEVKPHQVKSADRPEVNVPIVFSTEDGGETTVSIGTPVDLGELNTKDITKNVHDLVDNYKQINGTISYVWKMPDGTTVTVPVSVHITNGKIDSPLPTAEELSQMFTPTEEKTYTPELQITFTPDPVVDNGKFSDSTTAVAVTKRTEPGKVVVKANDADRKIDIKVDKKWKPNVPTDISSIDFVLKETGGQYIGGSAGSYTLVNGEANATRFTLSGSNDWKMLIEQIPGARQTSSGGIESLTYEVVETPVPYGYLESYSYGSVTVDLSQYVAKATVPIKVNVATDKILKITYSYGGTTYTKDLSELPLSIRNGQKCTFVIDNLPVDDNNEALDFRVISIDQYRANGTFEKTIQSKDYSPSITTEKVEEKVASAVVSTTEDLRNATKVEVEYTYNGTHVGPVVLKGDGYDAASLAALGIERISESQPTSFKITNLPVDGQGHPYPFTNADVTFKVYKTIKDHGVNVVVDDDDKTNKANQDAKKSVTVTVEGTGHYITGSKTTNTATITNTYNLLDLHVKKLVTEGDLDKKYPFMAVIEDTDTTNIFPAPQTGDSYRYYVDDSGNEDHQKILFELANNEIMDVKVNAGSTVYIKELEHNGYYPFFKDGEVVISDQDSASVTMNDEKLVKCYNTHGYELPSTGGMGTYIFTIGGLLLMAIAFMISLRQRRKSERGQIE